MLSLGAFSEVPFSTLAESLTTVTAYATITTEVLLSSLSTHQPPLEWSVSAEINAFGLLPREAGVSSTVVHTLPVDTQLSVVLEGACAVEWVGAFSQVACAHAILRSRSADYKVSKGSAGYKVSTRSADCEVSKRSVAYKVSTRSASYQLLQC